MSKASKQTHKKNLSNGNYRSKRQQVFDLINNGYTTIEQIMFRSGLPEKTISGRLTELNNLGRIKVFRTGKLSFYSVVTDEIEQTQIKERRKEITLKSGLKKVLN